jgi:hypothetical protein
LACTTRSSQRPAPKARHLGPSGPRTPHRPQPRFEGLVPHESGSIQVLPC